MNISSEHQSLMLAALYGELSAEEKQAWERLLASNAAINQEFERLQTTIAFINRAEADISENAPEASNEEAFMEAQWVMLTNMMREEQTRKPVLIALPKEQSDLVGAKIIRPSFIRAVQTAAKPRHYLAAATVLILLGFGASVYRWQMNDEAITQKVASEKASEGITGKQQSAPPPSFGQADGLSSSDAQTALKREQSKREQSKREQSKREQSVPAQSMPEQSMPEQSKRDESKEIGTSGSDADSDSKKKQAPKPASADTPSDVPLEKQRMSDDNLPQKDSYQAPSGAATTPATETSDVERTKTRQTEEAEKTFERKESPKQDVMRLQSTPSAAPQSAPSLKLMDGLQPRKRALPSGILRTSTNATIRLDSAQIRDSLRNRR